MSVRVPAGAMWPAAGLAAALLAGAPAVAHGRPALAAPAVRVRVNQVGYAAGATKVAAVIATRSLGPAPLVVTDARTGAVALRGTLGRPRGFWSRVWRSVYRVDLSALTKPGSYRLTVAGGRSPVFTVGDAGSLYGPLADGALRFFEAQRDGPNTIPGALGRAPSHLLDRAATVYAPPRFADTALRGSLVATGPVVDASGGWFDAGDYLKFVETTSFSDSLMELALRDHAGAFPDPGALRAEVRFATDWLRRMYDPAAGVLYVQVGLGDGDGSRIDGDHDLWRLPEIDDGRRGAPGSLDNYVSHRPVFAGNTPGSPISPNLAGRVAAAFALCAQVFADTDLPYARRCLLLGQQIYAAADRHPRRLVTSFPRAYYDEPEGRDDMAFGGAELYLATERLAPWTLGLVHDDPDPYLIAAGHYIDAYMADPGGGSDSLNVYDVATLADADLLQIFRDPRAAPVVLTGKTHTASLAIVADRNDQLALAARLARREPFGLANPSTSLDTVPHALGYAIQARAYAQMTGSTEFEALAQGQLAWALGANPWGSSFVVGAGRVFPHCLAHQIANLAGSLDGRPPMLTGATVDGPTAPSNLRALGAPDGYRRCPTEGGDRFGSFDSPAMAYRDDVRASSSVEPSIDFSALTLLAAAQQADG